MPGLGLGLPRPTPSEIFQPSSQQVRLEAAQSLSWPSNNPEGRKKTGKVPMEQEGGTRDATSFPRLRHVRAKMHPEQALVNALPAASTANPISMQEEAWFPSRNDAAHEEGEEKRQWGGRTILGHFQTPGLKSISLRIPIGGSVTRGRLCLAALLAPCFQTASLVLFPHSLASPRTDSASPGFSGHLPPPRSKGSPADEPGSRQLGWE